MSNTEKVNGCGPAWLKKAAVTRWIQRWLFDWFFEASCNKHDEGYIKGGDEKRRAHCDYRFLMAMLNDAEKMKPVFKIRGYYLAITFFILVRLFGWIFFNYTAEESNQC